jgi:archaellum component FlaC
MHGERDIRELEDDIASLSEGDTGIQKEITSRLAEAQQREDQAAAVADAIAGLEKDLEILAQDTLSTDRMRAERLERLTALQKEIADLRVETVASKSVIETMDERENFIRDSLPAELDRLEDRSARLKETEEYISHLDSDISGKENSCFFILRMLSDICGDLISPVRAKRCHSRIPGSSALKHPGRTDQQVRFPDHITGLNRHALRRSHTDPDQCNRPLRGNLFIRLIRNGCPAGKDIFQQRGQLLKGAALLLHLLQQGEADILFRYMMISSHHRHLSGYHL